VSVKDEFFKLVSIDSPSTKEGQLADYLKKRLKHLGAKVYEDNSAGKTGSDTGNLIAIIPGNQENAPPILLAAHMDTVVPTEGIVLEIKDGLICSDGKTILGADDKAGIAVILEVLSMIQEDKTIRHGPLEILLTVQEEVGLIGVKNLEYGLLAEYGYILDGDGPVGTVINAAPSHITLDLTMEGKAAHAGLEPEKGINAIVLAAQAISSLRSGRLDEETTSNFGIINGGKGRNVVPDKVEIKAEVRSRSREKLEKETDRMIKAFADIAARNQALFSYNQELAYESFTVESSHPAVLNVLEAGKRLDTEVILKATGGGLDANILNSRGIPCVALGLGNANPHTNEEYISIEQLEKSVHFLLAILMSSAK